MVISKLFWIFALCGPVIFWLLPPRLRLPVTAIVSVGLIAYFDRISAGLLLGAVLLTDISIRLNRCNARMSAPLFLFLGGLVTINLIFWKLAIIQKYFCFGSVDCKIVLPLGISYFSFKLIHFIIEFHRGRIENYRLDIFSVYIFLPTIFSAGPIQRYDLFISEMQPLFNWSHISIGITRIIYGIIKQFVLIGIVLNSVFPELEGVALLEKTHKLDGTGLWFFLLVFYLKLYLNFSAYTDIAIGTSRLFGFVIMENFHFPFVATSIDDFWRRWHMTLSGWCRDYVYQPILGLYRRPVLAAYLTFTVIGLWHAFTLSRLAWGFMHGTALVVYFYIKGQRNKAKRAVSAHTEKRWWVYFLLKENRILSWMMTQGFVVMSMAALVVEGNDLSGIGKIILRLFLPL